MAADVAKVAAWNPFSMIPGAGLVVGLIANHKLNQAAQRAFAEKGEGALTPALAGRISEIRLSQARNALAMSLSSLLTGAVLSAIVALGVVGGPIGLALFGAALVFGFAGLITGVVAISNFSIANQMLKNDEGVKASAATAAPAADADSRAV